MNDSYEAAKRRNMVIDCISLGVIAIGLFVIIATVLVSFFVEVL